MYKQQRDRLLAEKALGLSKDQANMIVARAYGYAGFDEQKDELTGPIDGLMRIKTPVEIKQIPDHTLQMMEFLRMAQNMIVPGLDNILAGHPQGTLIASMWGFSSFEALKTYARQDQIDPTSADPKEMARFKQRTGFSAPSQFLLGRDYAGNTLIIHTKPEETSHWIDQEICLNSLDDLQVALVRCNPSGDDHINRYSKHHDVFRQALTENHSSFILGARQGKPKNHLVISILPDREYTLEELVAAHYSALKDKSPRGRTLIIDRVPLNKGHDSVIAGLKLAKSIDMNVVYVTDTPDGFLWDQFASRLIFGFDLGLAHTDHVEMNAALLFATGFMGAKKQNLQLAYHSNETGPVYGVVQIVPKAVDQGAQLLKRVFGAQKLG